MHKKSYSIILLATLLMTGCGSYSTENTPHTSDSGVLITEEPTPIETQVPSQAPGDAVIVEQPLESPNSTVLPPDEIVLTAADHPELDFGLSAHDGEPIIRDYCFTNEGTLLLLQLSENLYEYSFDGKLVGIYDLHLKDNGLTASRVASGTDGHIYLLDGHSNTVITATREKIENVSFISFTDVGLFSRFDCTADGTLTASYLNENLEPVSVILDVSGTEAKTESERHGYSVNGELSFETTAIAAENLNCSDTVVLHLYKNGIPDKEYAVATRRTQGALLWALELLAASDDVLLARTYEWIPDPQAAGGERLTESYVLLDTAALSACINDAAPSQELPRYYGNQCFFLSRAENALSINNLVSLCMDWAASDIFFISEVHRDV